MKYENFDNIITISIKKKEKECILNFSKQIRSSINSKKISQPLYQLFNEIRVYISNKMKYFLKMYNKYKSDINNLVAIKEKELQKFSKLVFELNIEHTEAILLETLLNIKSEIRVQLEDLLKSSCTNKQNIIEFNFQCLVDIIRM